MIMAILAMVAFNFSPAGAVAAGRFIIDVIIDRCLPHGIN
jgi:hypothetical protein